MNTFTATRLSKLALLITVGAATTIVTGCGTTIRPGQMGMKYIALSDTALETEVRPEGFYWQWPWNDIIVYDTTLQSRDENVEVLTADDLHVPTRVTVTYRPSADEIYRLHTEIGPDYYQEVIRPAFMTLVRGEFAVHKHNDLARSSETIEHELLSKLRKALDGKPIEIDHVSIKHIRFDREVTAAISRKLTIEQQSDQKKFELEIAIQDAEIARTNAKGQGDSVRIRAEGEAEAVVLRGKGQAEAQAAISNTLTKQYLHYKAFDSDSTRYYFVPVGKDGMPIIINAEPQRR